MKIFPKFPFHSILFAIFPAVSLMAHNIGQISPIYIFRPIILYFLVTIILIILLKLAIKDWEKVGLIISPIIISNSMFGILFDQMQKISIIGLDIKHRSILAIVLGILLAVLIVLVIRAKGNLAFANKFLSIIGLAAVLIPIGQVGFYEISNSSLFLKSDKALRNNEKTIETNTAYPDIYYFILDGYARSDVLKKSFKYENNEFIQEIKRMGFYIADCSRSNYSFTRPSLSSSLNMDYLDIVAPEVTSDNKNILALDKYIQQNLVQAKLKDLGYKTVSFETGYLFTEFHQADNYIQTSNFSMLRPYLTPFERILLDESGFSLLETIGPIQTWSEKSSVYEGYLININKIELLSKLEYTSPKFVFVHLTISHPPYVFTPDGQFQEDTRFYSNSKGRPMNEAFNREGYINGITYLNKQIIPILKKLQSSNTPPIIIIQGDHGNMISQQQEIINAYYFPDQDYHLLYSNISPVNSFRVVFNTYFNQSIPLLPDHSYKSNIVNYPYEFTETREKISGCSGE
jgi:hypothetical protein